MLGGIYEQIKNDGVEIDGDGIDNDGDGEIETLTQFVNAV